MPVESLRARSATATTPDLRIPSIPTDGVLRHPHMRLSGPVVAGAVTALVLISLYLRTRGLAVHLWVDEAISVGISSHPLSQIPSLLRQDGSPPLYYVLLHFWISAFGAGESATHVLSLVFALLCIPVGYWAAASLFGRRAGLVCAVLVAGVPYLTAYGQETRMYSLLVLLSLIVSASFIHSFVRRRSRYLPVFSVSLAASLYTHNWALFLALLCAVAFVVCLWQADGDRWALWRDGALAFLGVLILYAPWLPTLLYQVKNTGAPWALPPVAWSLSQGMYFVVGGRGTAVALLLGGGAGVAAMLRGGAGARWLRLAVMCLLILSLGTLLVAWTYAKVTPAWSPRYLAVILGPAAILTAVGIARGGRIALAALALACCFWLVDPMHTVLDWKSNVATIAADVRTRLGPGDLVVSTQPEQVPALAYYLPDVRRFDTPIGMFPDPRVVDWRGALTRFRHATVSNTLMPAVRSLRPGQKVFLVFPMRFQPQPEYMHLIKLDTKRWTRALDHDRALRRVSATSMHWLKAGVPVAGILYVVRR